MNHFLNNLKSFVIKEKCEVKIMDGQDNMLSSNCSNQLNTSFLSLYQQHLVNSRSFKLIKM